MRGCGGTGLARNARGWGERIVESPRRSPQHRNRRAAEGGVAAHAGGPTACMASGAPAAAAVACWLARNLRRRSRSVPHPPTRRAHSRPAAAAAAVPPGPAERPSGLAAAPAAAPPVAMAAPAARPPGATSEVAAPSARPEREQGRRPFHRRRSCVHNLRRVARRAARDASGGSRARRRREPSRTWRPPWRDRQRLRERERGVGKRTP